MSKPSRLTPDSCLSFDEQSKLSFENTNPHSSTHPLPSLLPHHHRHLPRPFRLGISISHSTTFLSRAEFEICEWTELVIWLVSLEQSRGRVKSDRN
jgi:hypothetical protein